MKFFKNTFHKIVASWHDSIFNSHSDKTSIEAMDRFNKSIEHSRKIK
jgi:hypothetical protein